MFSLFSSCNINYIVSTTYTLTQTIQYLLPYPARFVGVQPKRKGYDHFKIVECSPTFRRSQITSLGAYRAKHSTLVYCSNGGSECRGCHPEQLHQLHFRHPNITSWDIHIAILADCNNCSFHSYIAIEISLNDWLSRLPNIVKSLSIFSVVILAYFCIVVMFVCPNTRLTLSMGTPLLRANVANPWREQWNEISFEIPHSFIIFFSGLQILQISYCMWSYSL